jgi:predicted O-methyltransferase YrrM
MALRISPTDKRNKERLRQVQVRREEEQDRIFCSIEQGTGSMLPEEQNQGKVTTIETDKESANIARKNIEDAALDEKVQVIEGDALDIIPKLHEKFDMVFLDGTKEEYFKYLKLVEKNLEKGAVVVADNVGVFEISMRDYIEYVRNSGRYNSRTLETELEFNSNTKDAIEISIKVV